jgi:hypothetical protein
MMIARVNSLLFCLAPVLCCALAGCVTEGQAKARERAAYLAGEQAATIRLQQAQAQGPSVRINGPVRTPVVPWTAGLSLSQAIMAAEYQGVGDPLDIIVVRNGAARRVDVKNLLSGQDVPLQPGDVVQIVPWPQTQATPGH